jgi:hypothetical protein
MLHSLRLSTRFDVARLQADLDQIISDDFVPHFNSRYYTGDWSVVALRSVGGKSRQIYPDPTAKDAFADTPLLGKCPYVREVLAIFQCPQQAVRFMRLRAGSVIREHKDLALAFDDGEVRFHIPVRTNPDVQFLLDGERVVMEEGECWYIDFTHRHSVANMGTTDRIHLVIDCVVNDWLRDVMLAKAANAGARYTL